jgi:hypothetical protein
MQGKNNFQGLSLFLFKLFIKAHCYYGLNNLLRKTKDNDDTHLNGIDILGKNLTLKSFGL